MHQGWVSDSLNYLLPRLFTICFSLSQNRMTLLLVRFLKCLPALFISILLTCGGATRKGLPQNCLQSRFIPSCIKGLQIVIRELDLHQICEVKYGFTFAIDPEVLVYHPSDLAPNQESSLCLNFSFFYGNLLF